MHLARSLAARYARTPEPFDDLVQVANLGLIKAVDGFDAERKVAFSSYAVPTILGELKRHFRDKGWSVRVPRGLQELVLKVQQAEAQLGSGARRSPTVVEIAEYLDLDTEQVLEALEASAAHHADSLDEPLLGEDEEGIGTRYDTIGANEQGYDLIEASATLAHGVARLRKLDREVLALRFRDGLKQSEIASRVGVSQMQVSRILRRVSDELRESMQGANAPGNGGEDLLAGRRD
jgi:RNA polymerase sigma-B factor